jgi:outer membrane lipoprotein-sorting protein
MVLNGMVLLAMIQGTPPLPLTAPEIVERMLRADSERLAALSGYTGMRRYRFENKRFNKRAEMTVRVTCDRTGTKKLEVIAESGSGFVRNHIIRKMIDAEREASHKGEHEHTRIIPANYDFRLVDTDMPDGRGSYVLEISPKTNNKFLIRGRIWVDAEDFAIVLFEVSPAKNPSFWIRSVQVVHRYERTGQFWLPAMNQSHGKARIFGPTDVSIEYFDT